MVRLKAGWASVIALLAIAGCGESGKQPPVADSPPPPPAAIKPAVPPSLPFDWSAIGASNIQVGPPVTLKLVDGYAYALLPATEVFPGDMVTATLDVTGPAGRPVKTILQRHCGTANGEDATTRSFVLSGKAQTEVIQHTFEKQYGCLRLTIISADQTPLDLTVNALSFQLKKVDGETTVNSDDPTFQQVSKDRSSFGKVIFYFGDSISRGAVLRKFPDRYTVEEANLEPYWRLRSPASTSNTGLDKKTVVAVFAGAIGQPHGVVPKKFSRLVSQGIIRSGDVVVLEDAGEHTSDPQKYYETWIIIRQALANAGATIIMVTMGDFVSGGQEADHMRYDVKFGGMSYNDATRAAAKSKVDGASRTVLVDLDKILSKRSYFREDGIHFNLVGQCVFANEVARVADVPGPDCKRTPAN